jgi:NAD(P)-dependent dehydrogenase (short-subunit alcohol dehydrogenase family)
LGTPIQRMGAPEEIAAFVSYVASDSAGFLTGKVILFLYPSRVFTNLSPMPAKANVYVYFSLPLAVVYLTSTLQQISVDGGYILD